MTIWMRRSSTPFWKVTSALPILMIQEPEGVNEVTGRSLLDEGFKLTGTMVNCFCDIRKAPPSS